MLCSHSFSVQDIALQDLVSEVVQTVNAWEAHFAAQTAGQPSTQPPIP